MDVATTVRCDQYFVKVFDSIYDSIDDGMKEVISNVFGSSAILQSVKIAKQQV